MAKKAEKETVQKPEKTAAAKQTPTPPATTATTPAPAGAMMPPLADLEDIEKNKVWAIVSYLGIIGVLVVALAESKNSPFAKFHLNQAVLLLIAGMIGGTVSLIIPIIGWFVFLPIVQTGMMILWILGIVNAAQGQTKRLPLIGNYDLFIIKIA